MGVRNHRYSSLDKINVNNIAGMKPAWSFSFGDEKQRGQEPQALVRDGVIYVTASYSRALRARRQTGKSCGAIPIACRTTSVRVATW